MQILDSFIDNLQTDEPQVFEQLHITPLLARRESTLPFLEIEEALRDGLVEITEVSDAGSVPNLEVTNKSLSDVLILDGEELIGAKQNRVVNTTIIVPAESSVTTPVSCVEQGRWRYNSKSFSTSDSFLYPSLRTRKHEDVTTSLRSGSGFHSNQGRIWDDIQHKSARLDVTSDTMSMSDIYESRRGASESLPVEIPYQQRQVGFLAFIRDGFAGGDVFGSPELCRRKLHKLLRSYYLDSLDEAVGFPRITSEQIFEQVRAASQEQFETVGKGIELRFESRDVQGAWKLVDDFIPHLMVFPKR
jgi:hypothetical protein